MKRTMSAILRNGFTKSKKITLEDMTEKLYFLPEILTKDGFFTVQSNGNPFWKPDNFKNRMQLLHDIQSADLREGYPFYTVYNRYENGDAYGIEKGFCGKDREQSNEQEVNGE